MSGNQLVISSSTMYLAPNGTLILSGSINATAGQIGGWYIGSHSFLAAIFDFDYWRGTIRTSNYITGQTGWSINSVGLAEFDNAIIRGTLSTVVFEKASVSAIGGQVVVAIQQH